MVLLPFFAGLVVGLLLSGGFICLARRDQDLPSLDWIRSKDHHRKTQGMFLGMCSLSLGVLFQLNHHFFPEYAIYYDALSVLLFSTALYDVVFRLIPLWLLAGLILAVAFGSSWYSYPQGPVDALIGAGVVGGLVCALYIVTRGKGIGEADLFLAAVIGALFAWERGLLVFSVANFLGLMVVLPLILILGKQKMKQIPLAFFLTLAIFLEWYSSYTDSILSFLRV